MASAPARRDPPRALVDALPLAVAEVDADGRVISWNRAAEELIGIPAIEAVGHQAVDLVVRPHEQAAAREVLERAAAGETWRGDLISARRHAGAAPDETVRLSVFVGPLESVSDRGAVVVTAEDVSARRSLERHAADIARHLTLALESGRLGTWHWDLRTGHTMWDPAMEQLFGLDVGTFDGTLDAWVALLHPDDVDEVLATVEQAVDARGSYVIEHRAVRPDGTVRWMQGRGSVTLDDDGEVTGTIGCTADITDHKEAEAEHERRRRDAERLARLERAQRERVEFLASLNDAALGAGDIPEMMRLVTAAAVPVLGDWCVLYVVAEPGEPPLIEVAHSDWRRIDWAREIESRYPYDPDAHTGVAEVIRTGRTEFVRTFESSHVERFIDDATHIEASELRAILDALELTSMVTVPLTSVSGVIGALRLVSAESRRVYDHDDVALAEAAAGRLAAALELARSAEHHRSVAATLQTALLPPALPSIGGIDTAARYWAAGAGTEVGGDFYDVFPIGEHRWALVVGDVCGKGPAAAAVTATARHTVRAAATHGADHVEVLEWLNAAIIAGGRGRYCTLVYATIEQLPERSMGGGTDHDPAAPWRMTLVCGGHPLPQRVRNGRVDRMGRHGTLVGVLPEVAVRPVSVDLCPGDVVVFSTDGVTDVPAPHGLSDDEFDELLEASIEPGGNASDLVERLGAAIDHRLAIRERADDVAVLVVAIE
jgi:PAS domain S-box-containing protein